MIVSSSRSARRAPSESKDAGARAKDSPARNIFTWRILPRAPNVVRRGVAVRRVRRIMDQGRLNQESFERLMAGLRPRLHRYCARMIGSAIDGEDVVQEALASAAEAFPAAGPILRPESWLFRIAHNAALDALRRRRRQTNIASDADAADVADPGAEADARVAATASLAAFMRLPAAQRSSAILIDVLGYSLDETADILGASLAATKAALHRARIRLR